MTRTTRDTETEMLTIHTTPDVEDTLSDSSPRRWTYHAEAGWQTGGWYGEAKQAAPANLADLGL